MRDSKTSKAIKLIQGGKWKSALSILRTFRLEFTKPQKRLIEISSDVLNGHGNFYRQIGVDTDSIVNEAKAMLIAKYEL